MDKLTKAREELCKDCQLGIHIEECSKCLFNVLNNNGRTTKPTEWIWESIK